MDNETKKNISEIDFLRHYEEARELMFECRQELEDISLRKEKYQQSFDRIHTSLDKRNRHNHYVMADVNKKAEEVVNSIDMEIDRDNLQEHIYHVQSKFENKKKEYKILRTEVHHFERIGDDRGFDYKNSIMEKMQEKIKTL